MATVTKPILLNETGEKIITAINGIATAISKSNSGSSSSGGSSGGGSNNAADIIVDDTAGHYVSTNVEDALAEAATNVDNVKTRVSTLETSNTSIKSSVTSLTSNVSTLTSNVSSLSSDVSTLSTKVNNMVSGPSANTTYFYTSGTYTVPAGVTAVYVSGCGGGAGGGHFYGGGGGASVIRQKVNVTPGQTISVTIGSGGAGKPASAGTISTYQSGTNGGTTKFGSYVSLTGGYAGKVSASTAQVSTWPRGGGNNATMGKTNSMQGGTNGNWCWSGGDGGSSLFGVGGAGGYFDQAYMSKSTYIAPNDGIGYGAGGGGACVLQNPNWASAAGAGTNGILIVEVV